jgi:hypothetical protein
LLSKSGDITKGAALPRRGIHRWQRLVSGQPLPIAQGRAEGEDSG